jgi:hypothetical protein
MRKKNEKDKIGNLEDLQTTQAQTLLNTQSRLDTSLRKPKIISHLFQNSLLSQSRLGKVGKKTFLEDIVKPQVSLTELRQDQLKSTHKENSKNFNNSSKVNQNFNNSLNKTVEENMNLAFQNKHSKVKRLSSENKLFNYEKIFSDNRAVNFKAFKKKDAAVVEKIVLTGDPPPFSKTPVRKIREVDFMNRFNNLLDLKKQVKIEDPYEEDILPDSNLKEKDNLISVKERIRNIFKKDKFVLEKDNDSFKNKLKELKSRINVFIDRIKCDEYLDLSGCCLQLQIYHNGHPCNEIYQTPDFSHLVSENGESCFEIEEKWLNLTLNEFEFGVLIITILNDGGGEMTGLEYQDRDRQVMCWSYINLTNLYEFPFIKGRPI